MRTQHLGDTMDFAKGGILKLAGPLLNHLVVIPMITAKDDWEQRHLVLYAKMLGLAAERILLPRQTFDGGRREEYFNRSVQRLPACADIFLDPDKGFSLSPRNRRSDQHVCCCDVGTFVDKNRERVLAIYCHRRAGAEDLCARVAAECYCSAFAYKGSACAMLFLSRNEKRLKRLRSRLFSFFAPMNETRLTQVFPAAQDNAS